MESEDTTVRPSRIVIRLETLRLAPFVCLLAGLQIGAARVADAQHRPLAHLRDVPRIEEVDMLEQ